MCSKRYLSRWKHTNSLRLSLFSCCIFQMNEKSAERICLRSFHSVGNVSACQCMINLLHGTESSNNHNVNSEHTCKKQRQFYSGLMWFTAAEYSSQYLYFTVIDRLRYVNCTSVMHDYTLSGKFNLSVNNFEPNDNMEMRVCVCVVSPFYNTKEWFR